MIFWEHKPHTTEQKLLTNLKYKDGAWNALTKELVSILKVLYAFQFLIWLYLQLQYAYESNPPPQVEMKSHLIQHVSPIKWQACLRFKYFYLDLTAQSF